jgi:isocitrate/isopropylmalate dehydrogenase
MKNYAIAAIPADGIGPEVISAGVGTARRGETAG